jgi:hypothetical protein
MSMSILLRRTSGDTMASALAGGSCTSDVKTRKSAPDGSVLSDLTARGPSPAGAAAGQGDGKDGGPAGSAYLWSVAQVAAWLRSMDPVHADYNKALVERESIDGKKLMNDDLLGFRRIEALFSRQMLDVICSLRTANGFEQARWMFDLTRDDGGLDVNHRKWLRAEWSLRMRRAIEHAAAGPSKPPG